MNSGFKVRAFVYYNSWNEFGWLKDLKRHVFNEIEIVVGDIRDQDRVLQAVKGCEYVFHLSSLIGIPYSYVAAESYIDTNVKGVLNVLNACRNSDTITRVLHTSTSEVYGSAQFIPMNEKHPIVGQSPYSASKIAADKLVESFHLSFDLPVVTSRPFNTYGPRQTARAVIPTIIYQLLNKQKYIRLGSLSPTRDFNYVADTVDAMMILAKADNVIGEVFNIGTGNEFSIEDLVKIIQRITDKKIQVKVDDKRTRPEKSEVNRLIADTTKIFNHTGWKNKIHLEKGLELTVRWIEKNKNCFKNFNYKI